MKLKSMEFWERNNSKFIFIPADQIEIDGNPYAGKDKIEVFMVDQNNPVFCNKDGYLCRRKTSNYDGTDNGKPGYSIIASTNLYVEYRMGKDIISIGKQAFKSSKLEEIILSPYLKSIGDEAFYNCGELQNVDFFDVTRSPLVIGYKAFSKCGRMESISLPANLIQISGDAFAHSDRITDIYMCAAVPPQIIDYRSRHPFLGISNNQLLLHVPSFAIEKYKQAEGWKDFDIVAEAVPNRQLFSLCLSIKNVDSYKELPIEELPLRVNQTGNEVSVRMTSSSRSSRFADIFVDFEMLLKNRLAASHPFLVSHNGSSREMMFENIEVVNINDDVLWYMYKWGGLNPFEIFRFNKNSYLNKIKEIALSVINTCEKDASLYLVPSQNGAIENISQLSKKEGWI